jgi:hypothetical protein
VWRRRRREGEIPNSIQRKKRRTEWGTQRFGLDLLRKIADATIFKSSLLFLSTARTLAAIALSAATRHCATRNSAAAAADGLYARAPQAAATCAAGRSGGGRVIE